MLGLGLGLNKNIIAAKTIQLNPTKDAFVYSFIPDGTNNGVAINLYNGGVGDSQYGLLHFDLSAIIGHIVRTANLRLYANNLALATIIGIQRITSNWLETTVTYNTRPTIDATVYYLESVPIGSNEWKNFDIITLVQAVAAGATYQGIWMYIGNPVSDYRNCSFSSKEGANDPILEIKYI
jgi:hypothetical protein